MIVKCVLIVDSDGTVALRKKMPFVGQLRSDQVGIPLMVNVPHGWFYQTTRLVTIDVPEPADRDDAQIEIGEPQQGDEVPVES